jgi:hypothetical protein
MTPPIPISFHPHERPTYFPGLTRLPLSGTGMAALSLGSREAFLLSQGSTWRHAILAGTPFVDEISRLLGCTYVPMNLLCITDAQLLTSSSLVSMSVT